METRLRTTRPTAGKDPPHPATGVRVSHRPGARPAADERRVHAAPVRQELEEFDELQGDPVLREDITQYVEQHAGLFAAATTPTLCHNDFHEGNVLVDPTTWQVNGFIDVENAIAADPLMDLAKTECYSIWSNADKLAGLVAGYGELPAGWRERSMLYRLYHSLELWDWFKSIGTVDPLDSIAGDLAAIARS
ncbi:phosphotransferase family protein [Kribbella qitaiheensis]|uniref:phosphotransferase family protein n=1 Tax=Kribbella qitaiheensis TaxID=1544730 RepID=UPI00360774EC